MTDDQDKDLPKVRIRTSNPAMAKALQNMMRDLGGESEHIDIEGHLFYGKDGDIHLARFRPAKDGGSTDD